MEIHRKNPTCNTCHQYMDPIGLSLDNFDVTGKWRYRENGMLLDTRGKMYDGTPVTTPSDLLASLLKRPIPLVRSFTENLMAYALGRRVEDYDQPTVRAIAKQAEANGYRISSFVIGGREEQCVPQQASRSRSGHAGQVTAARAQRESETMQILTGKSIPRRTFLRGMGATVALPYLDAMTPAFSAFGKARCGRRRANKTRLVCIESVHGAAGSNAWGASKNLWAPAKVGRDFELIAEGALPSLEPWRKYLTIVSNTDTRMAEAFDAPEIGGDHFRSSAVFLTQSHPKQTQGSDLYVGTSLDQIVARHIGQDTAIPSMQLCIENLDQAGGCYYNYACAYTDTISWASPSEPLPMIRNPRVAFDLLFGAGKNSDGPHGAPQGEPEHPRLDHGRGGWPQARARRRRPSSASTSISRTFASSSAAFRRSKRATRAAKRASCPKRRPACRIRSRST